MHKHKTSLPKERAPGEQYLRTQDSLEGLKIRSDFKMPEKYHDLANWAESLEEITVSVTTKTIITLKNFENRALALGLNRSSADFYKVVATLTSYKDLFLATSHRQGDMLVKRAFGKNPVTGEYIQTMGDAEITSAKSEIDNKLRKHVSRYDSEILGKLIAKISKAKTPEELSQVLEPNFDLDVALILSER